MRVFLLLCVVLLPCFANIIDIMNAMAKANMGQINTLARAHIPASYGDCNDNNPPAPCICSPSCQNLYYIHKSWAYKAYARWITGLNTINFTSILFSAAPGVMSAQVIGQFDALPLSLWIGECATFDQCIKLWDNTQGCCGTDKHFELDIDVTCGETAPHLTNARIRNLYLDQFVITEKVIGIKIKLQDITDAIEKVVSSLITDYLTVNKFIPWQGQTLTLLEFANSVAGVNFTCPNANMTEIKSW